MVLKIFRAADAFLYLPTYVAEEFGIFETLLKPLGINGVEFITSDAGDIKAIELMLAENSNANDSIAIAVADPIAFLSKQITMQVEEVRVIGAIINKLPFWAVNHTDRVFDTINDFSKEFSKVIYYNENFITGHYLGIKVKTSSKIGGYGVSFGQEIPAILAEDAQSATKSVAITADIVSLVKGISLTQNPLKINYKFSKDGSFFTTGVITSKKCCDSYSEKLNKIIEAIQKSISFIYSSDKMAGNICATIAKKSQFSDEPLTALEISKIIELINEEKFYPADLNIAKDGWNKAIRALAKTEHWESKDEREVLKKSFGMYVDNRFILNSERSIANQFGIGLDSFEKEIKRMPLYAIAYYISNTLKHLYNWIYSSSLKLFIIFLLTAIAGASGYFWYFDRTSFIYPLIFAIFGGALASLLAARVYDIRKRKDENNN